MSTNYQLAAGPGPSYLAVSAALDASGDVQYRILRIDRPGERLVTVLAGSAARTCTHSTCALANLGAAAVDWAYLLQHEDEGPEFHPEQLTMTGGLL